MVKLRHYIRKEGKKTGRKGIYYYYYYYYLLLNVRFGSLLGPRGLLLIYMWGENSI